MNQMNIKQIETFPLFYRLKKPYGDANGYKSYRSCFLFRILTDSGLEGWGECVDWLPTLEKGFREKIVPFLLGKKATDRAALVSTISKWNGRIAAGVSMALTEIVAKHAGLSIPELWGGRRRREIPVYASFQSYTEGGDWIRHSLSIVEKAIADGFRMAKVKVGGKTLNEDVRHISSLMQMINGQAQIAIDANQSYDIGSALTWNSLFAKFDNWLWFEEALPLDQPKAYAIFRARCAIPVAGGENIEKPLQFTTLMREGSLDIIQPDPMHMKGIDTYRDTLQIARYHRIRVSPHAYDGILSRVYALFAQSCLPAWSKMAGDEIEPVEWDVMENPFTSLLPLQPMNGMVTLPGGIGLGMKIDPRQLEPLLWDGTSYK
jgi:D-galactarolactone cycloisomerase